MPTIPALRLLCLIEGLSLLALFGIAMPLKHLANEPLAVRYVGLIHGVLWIALVVVLVLVARRHQWSLGRSAAVFVSSILPFGFLAVDGRMKTWSKQASTDVQPGEPD